MTAAEAYYNADLLLGPFDASGLSFRLAGYLGEEGAGLLLAMLPSGQVSSVDRRRKKEITRSIENGQFPRRTVVRRGQIRSPPS